MIKLSHNLSVSQTLPSAKHLQVLALFVAQNKQTLFILAHIHSKRSKNELLNVELQVETDMLAFLMLKYNEYFGAQLIMLRSPCHS